MRSLTCLALLALLWVVSAAWSPAADAADEKLLLGFEEEEIARLDKAIKVTRKEGKTKDGKPFVALESPGGFAALGQWALFKGNASQGDYAMGVSLMVHPDYLHYAAGKFELPAEAVLYYGLLNYPHGARLHTCGVFRRMFPMDWSDYDLFRLDVYCHEVKQTVSVLLDDEEISPPIERNI